MDYPTMEQAIAADYYQVCKWHRFLPSPGINTIRKYENLSMKEYRKHDKEITEAIDRETQVAKYLWERFIEGGGMSPEMSRSLGYNGET